MIGGWQLGNSIDGVQAEYFRVPYAQANLAKIPDDLTDEQCVLLADIASTGISAAETANVQIGQTVAVFAQGPIGLCATAGAHLKGAALIIGVDAIEGRLQLSRRMGADEVIDFTQEDPVAAIKRLTGGRGVDVAIEALGKQETKLMELVRVGRLDLSPLITHRFSLDEIEGAYELFGNQRDGVVKVALTP